MNLIFTQDLKTIFPKKVRIGDNAGNWELELGDAQKTFPRLQVSYGHSTPSITGDVLSDGEPDNLGFDIHFLEEGTKECLNVDVTYGDAMMFSFKMKPSNIVEVGHYNGYGSKFDPERFFYFKEDTIMDLINLFNSINPILRLSRDKFNFMDGDKNSFKMEKVRFISDFKTFNLLNRP